MPDVTTDPGAISTADPFDPLLLAPDADSQPCSQPDLFGEFLHADPVAAPATFPEVPTSSAPLPSSATFLPLGEHLQQAVLRSHAIHVVVLSSSRAPVGHSQG